MCNTQRIRGQAVISTDSGLGGAGPSFEIEQKAKDVLRRVAEYLAGKELTGSALRYLRQGRIDMDGAGDGGKFDAAGHGDYPLMNEVPRMAADDLTAERPASG